MSQREPFEIGGHSIPPGSKRLVQLDMPEISSEMGMSMAVHVWHGKRPGPTLFVCGAIHGDELNGVEIVRRVLATKSLARLRGTLLAVPVVNAYGLIEGSRYLPDRRDLNRCFPGSERGSLGGRLAYLFMTEVVDRCSYGIDLHTGSNHRTNLPQIRADLNDEETAHLAECFGTPVLLNSDVRDGSLRGSAAQKGIRVLLYEAGEALRYNEVPIRAGVAGVISVMRALEMLPPLKTQRPRRQPFVARSSRWERAPESGMLRCRVPLGADVSPGDLLGHIVDPSGGVSHDVTARHAGVVIGRLELPMVYEGDAIYHIARFKSDATQVADYVDSFRMVHLDPHLFD